MLTFNHSGFLVPDNAIISNLNEFEDEFVSKIASTKRKTLFDLYLKYSSDLKNICDADILQQWINGSYVSKKVNPGDIDLVTFLDYRLVNILGDKLKDFTFPQSEGIYGVDAYIVIMYPQNHKEYSKYVSDRLYWMDRFTKTRRIRGNKHAKGFLELSF